MPRIFGRILILLIAGPIALPPLSGPASAALTALADQPIVARVPAAPNIVYTLDDSGSMAANYLPDFVTRSAYPAYCRADIGSGLRVNAGGAPYYDIVEGFDNTTRPCSAGAIDAFHYPPFYAAAFNHLAYDPYVRYWPPLQAGGTPLTYDVGAVTDALGNQLNLKRVQSDPYLSPATTVDLSAPVAVPVYCNTDWPTIGNPVAQGEIGNAVGEYVAGAGAHCRINGTAYDANGNGAPKVDNDYNYPWPKVGTATGTPGVPNAAPHFWRQNATRQIWCDKTHASWPQTCAGGPLTTCTPAAGACTDLALDPATGSPLPYTLLDDANLRNGGSGAICRRNNFDYTTGATVNAPANFPSGVYSTPVSIGCPADIPTSAAIPRHYYVLDSVEFCATANDSAGAQWRGFGASACQRKNDFSTYRHVKYGRFRRVDLLDDGRAYDYVDPATGVDPVTGKSLPRTYAEEARNYANWYAYYRTRILAAKTVSSIAFSHVDDTYRVGFHTFGTSSPTPVQWLDVDRFDLAHRTLWYDKLFGLGISNYRTYTMSALLRVGNLFATGGAGGLPSTVNPLPASARDPLTLSCQSNYHIVITDGFTNEPTLPAMVGDRDAVVPSFASRPDVPPDNVLPTLRSREGMPWPAPFVQQTMPVADTLADIATYYWANDLRSGMIDNVPADTGKGGGDIDYSKDVAWWQHLNFNAISFGSEGTLDAVNAKATVSAIIAGTAFWPDLTDPNSPPNPPADPGAAGVDDLWHATVNARGVFAYAQSPADARRGLSIVLDRMGSQTKTQARASFAGGVLAPAADVVYATKIRPGWTGDLLKLQIDPITGSEVRQLWSAAAAMYDGPSGRGQIHPSFFGDEPWMDESKRRLVTFDTRGKPVPFRYPGLSGSSGLDAAQLGTLGATPTAQQQVIAYLRGGSTVTTPVAAATVAIEGTSATQFRPRVGPLGDFANAQPAIVSAPSRPFDETHDPGYSGYKAAAAARPDRVVAPANDGIVHVFDGADGHEVFGFVPKTLLRSSVDSTGEPDGIHALTLGDFPKHRFYADASPRAADVDFSPWDAVAQRHAGTDWRTIVVGGLGKGGSSYYALDLSDAAADDDGAAMAKLLWEVRDPDWNYTHGRPLIVKTRAFGWTVIVTSGYNNASEEGRLHFLAPSDGSQMRAPLSVGNACGAGNPAGLAQISGFTKDYHNAFVEQVYGGDLCGNVWRFDLANPDAGQWTASKLAVLTDPAGAPQPITIAPQIEIDFGNGVDRYVFVGTGKLLDPSDLTHSTGAQQQTMYAIRDGSLAAPLSAGLPIRPRATMAPISGDGTSAIAGGAPNGWYHDLPTDADHERIVVDVEAGGNTVAYVGTRRPTDPCSIALPATVYAREFATGRSLVAGAGDAPLPSYTSSTGSVGVQIVSLGDKDGRITGIGALLTTETGAGTKIVPFLPARILGNHRFSWRLLGGS